MFKAFAIIPRLAKVMSKSSLILMKNQVLKQWYLMYIGGTIFNC